MKSKIVLKYWVLGVWIPLDVGFCFEVETLKLTDLLWNSKWVNPGISPEFYFLIIVCLKILQIV